MQRLVLVRAKTVAFVTAFMRSRPGDSRMKKTVTALTAAAAFAVVAVGAPSDANAWRRHGHGGGAVAAGIIGGLAAGAIIGSAAAGAWGPNYVVAPGYMAYPAYGGPAPVGCPGGYWARMPLYDAYGNVVGYRGRPRFFCP
jgi:hypothetical protein